MGTAVAKTKTEILIEYAPASLNCLEVSNLSFHRLVNMLRLLKLEKNRSKEALQYAFASCICIMGLVKSS
jgi:hypothetical protein